MAKRISTVPIKQQVTRNGLVDIVWSNFFQSIYQLFQPSSYGYQTVSLSASGVTGNYSISASYLTDRDFVDYYITIVPSGSISLSATSITGFPDAPINPVYPCTIYQITSASEVTFSGEGGLYQTGELVLPDLSGSDRILVQGRFIRLF